jgi:hypothetical protein
MVARLMSLCITVINHSNSIATCPVLARYLPGTDDNGDLLDIENNKLAERVGTALTVVSRILLFRIVMYPQKYID